MKEKKETPVKVNDGLPEAPTSQVTKPEELTTLIVAPPGWGKTELFTSSPDCVLLAAEEGHRFVECHKIILDTWDEDNEFTDGRGNLHLSFIEAINRLEASERFEMVVIDTLDMLIKKCIDFHLGTVTTRSKGVIGDAMHISQLGDFGMGYDLAMNNPIRHALGAILATGRGLGLTTHQALTTYDAKGNIKPVRKETTLPNGIIKFIFGQCDLILHGEFGLAREDGVPDRIIRSQGSEEMLAKNRGGILPPAYIVDRDIKKRWPQFTSFFDPKDGAKSRDKAYEEFLEHYEEIKPKKK